ncbi:MAG: hypothetical protein ACUVTX_12090 [Bacteroidales bacterium]
MKLNYLLCIRPSARGKIYIHSDVCPLAPEPGKRIMLGCFASPAEAIEEAKSLIYSPEACPFCCREHTRWNHDELLLEMVTAEAFVTEDHFADPGIYIPGAYIN